MPSAGSSLDTIVAEAVQLATDAERSEYLSRTCGDDEPLRRRAESLIAAHFRAGSFLEQPAVAEVHAQLPDDTGTTIGAYHLLEKIGEGGMGVVYVADQSTPVKRRVALKIIKPGMDTREVIARFEAERQALALMDHPNIARVFDGGATATGRPYFVMELVRGLPITEYCDHAKLSPERRLKLFVQVCRAVQHAHQKGVIHRDLKPSNVLITLHDGEPVPKVIDFGVAKAIGTQLTEHSAYTRFTQMIGTPLYMSPEQAELSGLDIDTRSDVYSLGVLLYELLAGTTPFDSETLRRAGFDEMRRMIREDDPPRPSARVSTLEATSRSTVSNLRGLDDRQLSRLLSGDLDWIVMKALEKNRGRRYESAGAMAADIERYLANEPVEARQPTAGYRVRKFVRRNRKSLAAMTVFGAGVLVVAGTFGWGLRDAAARRLAAEQSASAALAESTEHYNFDRPEAAMATAIRAVETLKGVDGRHGLLAAARQQVADLSMAARLENLWFDTVDSSASSSPAATAAAFQSAFDEFGIDPVEMTEAEIAMRVRTSLIVAELVNGLDSWAAELFLIGGRSDPLATKLNAIAQAADPDPWSCRVREVILEGIPEPMIALGVKLPIEIAPRAAVRRLGIALGRVGAQAEAESLLRRAARLHAADARLNLSVGQLLRKSSSQSTRRESLEFYRAALAVRPRSAAIRNSIGALLTDHLGQPENGVEWFLDALSLKPDYTLARINLSIALGKLGRSTEAIAAAREAVAATPNIQSYANLANQLTQFERRAEAAEAWRAILSLPAESGADFYWRGMAFDNLNKNDDAIAAFREAIRLGRTANALRGLGVTLSKLGKLDEAISSFQEAIRLVPSDSQSYRNLGRALRLRGKLDESIPALRESIRLDPSSAESYLEFGYALSDLNRTDEAIVAFQEEIRLRPSRGPALAQAHYNLGFALNKAGRESDAEAAYRKAIEIAPELAEAHCNLANLLMKNGRFADALASFQRGHELGSKKTNWRYPSARWVENARRLAILEPRIPAIMAGADELSDANDAAAVARVAFTRKDFGRSAELYRSAIRADPTTASDLKIGWRYSGACAAAQLSCLDDEKKSKYSDSTVAAWRQQALDWLQADLSALQKLASSETRSERTEAQNKLAQLQRERDLECVRAEPYLAKLTDAERAEWQSFWSDVRATLETAHKPASKKQ